MLCQLNKCFLVLIRYFTEYHIYRWFSARIANALGILQSYTSHRHIHYMHLDYTITKHFLDWVNPIYDKSVNMKLYYCPFHQMSVLSSSK